MADALRRASLESTPRAVRSAKIDLKKKAIGNPQRGPLDRARPSCLASIRRHPGGIELVFDAKAWKVSPAQYRFPP